MNNSDEILEIALHGQFTLRTMQGVELTPKGRKACAVLALLAESETMTRSRLWLEQTLWSDRAAEQARGSLRQTLFELRRQLGNYSHVIYSDRNCVSLDKDQVQIAPANRDKVFLQGLNILDPVFQEWLKRKRIAFDTESQTATAATKIVRIQCGLQGTANRTETVGARILNDQVGGIISSFIARSRQSVLDSNADLIVRATVKELAQGTVLEAQVIDANNDSLIHSDYSVAGDLGNLLSDDAELTRFCWKVADSALDQLALSRCNTDPMAMRAAWSQEAISAVLSFDHSIMPQSLNILDEANGIIQDGLFYALQAWAMMSLIMEERLEETEDTLSAVSASLNQARQLASAEPMVNGICANVYALLFEDHNQAMKLSASTLKIQRHNIFATQAMSLCRFNMGLQEEAYALSRRNRDIALPTKFGPMCNLHHALVCLRTRRPDEAIDSSNAASVAVPKFRAPNRQLVALYAAAGQIDAASSQAKRLSAIEPGFTIDRLVNDEMYPANTLRESGILDLAKRNLT